MEAYIRQKRASPGMVQATDLQILRPKSGVRSGPEAHAYDGPMQFMMSSNNPDQIVSTHIPITQSIEGKNICSKLLLLGYSK